MDRIGLAGIRWHEGASDDLARFTIPIDERATVLANVRESVGARELVYLATCNRVEIVFVADDDTPLPEYRPRLYEALTGRRPTNGDAERTLKLWAGEGAVEHLFLVVCGLDSSLVGETEILGQVRGAYDFSRSIGLIGPRTEWLFEEAFKVSRRVRRSTSLGGGKLSLSEIALDHVRDRLRNTPGAVGVVGVSPMTQRCAEALAARRVPVFVFNRSLEHAEELAQSVGGTARALSDLGDGNDALEALVFATGSSEPVVGLAELEKLAVRSRSGRPPLIIDLANPPDVEPAHAEAAGLARIGIEEVLHEAEEHRDQRLVQAVDARTLVDRALRDLARNMSVAALAPVFAALQRRYRQTAIEGVERLFRKDLAGLCDAERVAVQRWAEALARRLAHVPTAGLRAVAKDSGFRAVEQFLAAADARLAEELRSLAGDGGRPRPPARSDVLATDGEV